MTEYLIVFKGQDFDPIHAMSFDDAVKRVEDAIENRAEIHYALEVEIIVPGYRDGFDCTEKLENGLLERYYDREAEAAKRYVDTNVVEFRRETSSA